MRSTFRCLCMQLSVLLLLVPFLSLYVPSTAHAGIFRTALGLFGAVAGATLMATLAASFGPVGIACAGLVGGGLGLLGGVFIGTWLGIHGGGFAGGLGGLIFGGMLGAAGGAFGAAILAANSGLVAVCAGALVGAWAGARLTGIIGGDDDRDHEPGPVPGPIPFPPDKPFAYRGGPVPFPSAPGVTPASGEAASRGSAGLSIAGHRAAGDRPELRVLKRRLEQARARLDAALTAPDVSARITAKKAYDRAFDAYRKARTAALAK